MFEKYTAKARKVIFFARFEVSELGAKSIDPEHLLLGLLREDQALITRFLPAHISVDEIRKQVEKRVERGAKISTSVEIPLSDETKEALKYAADESQSLGHEQIGTEHLLLGMLRQQNSVAEGILSGSGVALSDVRHHVQK